MLALLSFLTLPIVCIAQVIPTAPGPGQEFTAGSECSIKWKLDTTGAWKTLDIDLMSGSNNNMSRVTNVVSDLDGTSFSSYSWKCPEVQPYAAIYFYQFNQKNASAGASHAWTTRFTILSETGGKTSPEYSRQPNGDPIPWGIGRLASADKKLTNPHGEPTYPRKTISTSHHPKSSKAKTRTPHEVTLDVPAPEPTRNFRRITAKAGVAHTNKLPCRRGTINAQSDCKTRLRNKPRWT